MWTDLGWFIHQLEVWICVWSLALWPPSSCTCTLIFTFCILVLYGELIWSSFVELNKPPPFSNKPPPISTKHPPSNVLEINNKPPWGLIEHLKPSTIDGWGEGTWRSGSGRQAILEGNQDNPESGTHQAPSHWESEGKEEQILTKTASREEGGLGAKNNYNYCTQKQHEQNDWLLRKCCKITKALLNLKTAPHTISGEDRWPALSCV